MTMPSLFAALPPPAATLTRLQLRTALYDLGHLEAAMTAVASLPLLEQVDWDCNESIRSDSALIVSLKGALGLTDEDIAQLYLDGQLIHN